MSRLRFWILFAFTAVALATFLFLGYASGRPAGSRWAQVALSLSLGVLFVALVLAWASVPVAGIRAIRRWWKERKQRHSWTD